jgi:glycogen synthase
MNYNHFGLHKFFNSVRVRSERVFGRIETADNFESGIEMPIATFYFQLHQPFRLHPSREKFVWDELNKEVFEKVSHKCYLPATRMFTKLIEQYPGFKITFSMSGAFLEQAQMYKPEVITCLQELFNAGKKNNQAEFLEETYYHSLASLFGDPHRQEFRDQIALHRGKMEDIFGFCPSSFRNTELMFNNDIAAVVADLGYKAMLCEKRNDMFGQKDGKLVSPNAVFRAKTGNLIVIPRNRELSDDIAFRFPHTPVLAEDYAKHIADIDGEAVLLGYDYEHIGEHIWEDKGIFEFWKKLPAELMKYKSIKLANPTEVADFFKKADCPVIDIHGLSTSSWADTARDTFGWLGNNTQQEFFSRIQSLEKKAKTAGGELLTKWRILTTSDHLYFLHESTGSDQAVHSYFSPYGTIGETVRTIADKLWMLGRSLERFTIMKKHTRTPVIIISPETDRLPTKGMGDFAQYVSGKSGGMGEVVAALCRGLSNRGVRTYIITLNLQRKFMAQSGMTKEEYIENLYHLPRDKIKMVDSSIFENYMSAYDGDPRATAAEFQRQIKRFLIGEILSKHEGRGIIHSHDWMAGGIITAFAKLRSIPVLHTLHNSHTGYVPLEMFGGVNLSELWSTLYLAHDFGRECVDCQSTAIKNAALVNYVGDRFLQETIQDYFTDRHFIPPGVRKETKAKYRYGCAFSIPNGISPSVYPENQIENPEVDKPGLAKIYGLNDHVIEAKKLNLVKFQKKTGLQVNPEAILLYWPSRLDRLQKGIELLEAIALRFTYEHPDVQIAVVGNPVGDNRMDADILGKIAVASKGKIAYWPFSDDLSTIGYAAASDVFGASLYEPFGQIDLVGNLYGATATNRDTGGFHDKIVPLQLKKMGAPEDAGNGVLFENYDAGGLWYGLHLTVENHRFFRKDQAEWEKQAKRIMRDARNNWGLNKMIAGYLSAYERILGHPVV